jgi:hypothetical protein
MRLKMVSALALAAALTAVTGCGNGNNAGAGNGGPKAQSYSNDGYLGITSSYPHVPGRHMALNYASDARMMRDSIRNVRGVAGADITFHGAEAYVRIKRARGLAGVEVPTLERQAASVLRFNFPRYTVHVSSKP